MSGFVLPRRLYYYHADGLVARAAVPVVYAAISAMLMRRASTSREAKAHRQQSGQLAGMIAKARAQFSERAFIEPLRPRHAVTLGADYPRDIITTMRASISATCLGLIADASLAADFGRAHGLPLRRRWRGAGASTAACRASRRCKKSILLFGIRCRRL